MNFTNYKQFSIIENLQRKTIAPYKRVSPKPIPSIGKVGIGIGQSMMSGYRKSPKFNKTLLARNNVR